MSLSLCFTQEESDVAFLGFLGGSYGERWAGSDPFIGVTVFGGSSTCSCTDREREVWGRIFFFLCRMKMLSPANGDQLHLVNYVEDYLDSIESMPFDLQRNVSLMREIDAKYQGKGFLYMCVCMSVRAIWGSGGRLSFPFFSSELSLGSACPSAHHRDGSFIFGR